MAKRKHTTDNLLLMFKIAARSRNEMLAAGFNDNAGAIHSAERILGILAQYLKYPELTHINSYKKKPHAESYAEFSIKAWEAYNKSEKIQIEHVAPHRDFTCKVIDKLNAGASDDELKKFIVENFRLVILTPEETLHLNKINRTIMDPQRLEKAGIKIATKKIN